VVIVTLKFDVKSFLADDSGATAIEYVLIASAIGLMLASTIPFYAEALGLRYTALVTAMRNN
jgi:pilus assembly protein Flp/PilA